MCGPLCYPVYIPAPRPAGQIKPDEISLEAALRRYYETPKRDMPKHRSVSETSTLASLSFKERDSTQGFPEKDHKITTVEETQKSHRSFRGRWLDFKRKHLH